MSDYKNRIAAAIEFGKVVVVDYEINFARTMSGLYYESYRKDGSLPQRYSSLHAITKACVDLINKEDMSYEIL